MALTTKCSNQSGQQASNGCVKAKDEAAICLIFRNAATGAVHTGKDIGSAYSSADHVGEAVGDFCARVRGNDGDDSLGHHNTRGNLAKNTAKINVPHLISKKRPVAIPVGGDL